MHELSVCVALIEQVERFARDRPESTVTRVIVKLGPLSGVEPQLLLRSYPLAISGTVAEKSSLRIDPSDVVVHCSQCGCESPATPNRLLCGTCGDYRTRIVSGDEMILQSIEFAPDDSRVPLTAVH